MTAAMFPNATGAVITYLDAALAAPVLGRVPNPRPTRFVRVERIGGPRETRVTDAARFAVEAWAETDYEAEQLLNAARAVLSDVEGGLFGADEYGGPASLPDPVTNSPRFTASFTIRVRAS